MEDIKIFQGNSGTIRGAITSGLSDLTGYTGHIIAAKNKVDIDLVLDLSTNDWDASTATFSYTSLDSSINPGKYVYEFYVDNSSNVFTIDVGNLYISGTLNKII